VPASPLQNRLVSTKPPKLLRGPGWLGRAYSVPVIRIKRLVWLTRFSKYVVTGILRQKSIENRSQNPDCRENSDKHDSVENFGIGHIAPDSGLNAPGDPRCRKSWRGRT
jgi:hypothetical protein